ncbi:porin [Variovorax sp. GT1P44]|uniref:porin n=1 Tax=Variovorax sp. GT1P44 TaxID=3443742 RepID=UPI003F497EEC
MVNWSSASRWCCVSEFFADSTSSAISRSARFPCKLPVIPTHATETAVTSSGYNSSRLGFRGTEDLGGGMAASFWLEAGINSNNGSGVGGGGLRFDRRSTISLSGPFGEFRGGRDYTPTYWNDTVFDPFGTNGVGASLINTASKDTGDRNYTRASNSIGYFLPPNLGGVYGQLMYVFNEKASLEPGELVQPGIPEGYAFNNSRTGRYIGGRVGYAKGPLDVALSYGQDTVASDFYAGSTTNLETVNLGASYDFGPVKLFGEYSDNKLKTDWSVPVFVNQRDPGFRGWLLGATVPVGPGVIRAAYSAVDYQNIVAPGADKPKAGKFAIGYVHNLSKRTAVYTTIARVTNKNGAALSLGGPQYFLIDGAAMTPKTSTGYDIGLRHSF